MVEVEPARPYLQVSMVTVTSNDLRCLPRLTGDSHDDPGEILKHSRVLCGLKAAPLSKDFADIIALREMALVSTGRALAFIHHESMRWAFQRTRPAFVFTCPRNIPSPAARPVLTIRPPSKRICLLVEVDKPKVTCSDLQFTHITR